MILVHPSSIDFQDDVLKALTALCPCRELNYQYRPDGKGLVRLVDTKAETSCYPSHTAACNLICDLIVGDNTTEIEQGMNEFDCAGGVELGWDPTDYTSGLNEAGNMQRPPRIGLAHEMVHAIRAYTGKDCWDEVPTVCGENQIRLEQGVPLRIKSGIQDTPFANCSEDEKIDHSDRPFCGKVKRAEDIEKPSLDRGGLLEKIRAWLERVLKWPPDWPWARPRVDPRIGERPMGTAQDRLARQIEFARFTRSEADHRRVVEDLGDDLAPNVQTALLEVVVLDGAYRVMWFILGDPPRLVSNVEVRPDEPVFWFGQPGALHEYTVPGHLADDVRRVIGSLEFEAGEAGREDLVDGAAHFLRLTGRSGAGEEEIETVLYGERFPGHSAGPYERSGDPRWVAVARVMQLGRRVIEARPSSRELAPVARF